MIRLVPARLTHVGPIASRMRVADRIEVGAMGHSPRQALRMGLLASLKAYTVLIDGRPEAMLGAVSLSLLTGKGVPWMLGTDEMYRQGKRLLLWGPAIIEQMLEDFHSLENVVSAGNFRAIRLLTRWGFEVGNEQRTIGGVAFLPFAIQRPAPEV